MSSRASAEQELHPEARRRGGQIAAMFSARKRLVQVPAETRTVRPAGALVTPTLEREDRRLQRLGLGEQLAPGLGQGVAARAVVEEPRGRAPPRAPAAAARASAG